MSAAERRAYLESHPWLTFALDLSRTGPNLWLQLGEARSKIEHISGALLKPEVAARLHLVFLAKGVHATTAIEGNTLTEDQARQLIEGTLRLPPSQQHLATELANILKAFGAIRDEIVSGGRKDMTPALIARFNLQVLEGLDLEDDVVPGALRTHTVVVARYRGAPAEDCDYLLSRLCSWLNGTDFVPADPEWRVPFAILKAIAAHLYLAWIHPFVDGNGRTARLMELQILLAAGVPTPAAHLLSNHYNQTCGEYQRRLDEASRDSDRGVLAFVQYAVSGFVDGLREQLDLVREQQFDDRWEQYVYEFFGDARSAPEIRRRQLLLDLSKAKRPVRPEELRRLSPAVAAAYAQKTAKTLSRDLNALSKDGLIRFVLVREDGTAGRYGYVPSRELIEAFLPLSAPGSDEPGEA